MTARRLLSLAAGAWLALAAPCAQARNPEPPESPIGTWINPRGTVRVKTGLCGINLCGWVVWASSQALDDARSSGVNSLIGTELLRNYRATSTREWHGQVYVPDMGETFYSRIVQLDPNSLKISGCILGGLICKSQVWQKG